MEYLIDKDALVAEIERRILILQKNPYENHKTICHLDSLKQFINTLEVKEVDLEKEIEFEYNPIDGLSFEEYSRIAKYFFELGVNVSNPLTWEDIKIILDIEIDILRECNSQKELVIKTYPKGEDYYGEILKRFKEKKVV